SWSATTAGSPSRSGSERRITLESALAAATIASCGETRIAPTGRTGHEWQPLASSHRTGGVLPLVERRARPGTGRAGQGQVATSGDGVAAARRRLPALHQGDHRPDAGRLPAGLYKGLQPQCRDDAPA